MEKRLKNQLHYAENKQHYKEVRARYYLNNKADCQRRNREWNENNKLKARNRRLRRSYSITLEQYQAMYDEQLGVCAICGKRERKGGHLSVDHCHKTGKVRGLLCDNCNVGMGRFNDDPDRLRAAANYAELHNTVAP